MNSGLTLRNIPFKNIKAHRMRTRILLILTLAQAFCVFAGMMMMQGMKQELQQAEARLGADVLVYPTAAVSRINMDELLMQGTPVEVYKERSQLSKMDYCEGIRGRSYQIYLSDTDSDGEKISIVGYDPATDFVLSPWVVRGESLDLPPGCVAVGAGVLNSGQSVQLFHKEWPVAAHLEETGSYLDHAVFVPLTTMKELLDAAKASGNDRYASVDPDRDYSVCLLRVDDGKAVQSVTDWINIYVRKVTAVRGEETLNKAASGLRGTTLIMLIITAAVWGILIFSLGITQNILMKERVKELFVWHSIGASGKLVRRLMRREAFLVHLWGALAGVVLGSLIFLLFGNGLVPGYRFDALGCVLGAGVSLVVTVLTGMAATVLTLKAAYGKLNAQMLLTV